MDSNDLVHPAERELIEELSEEYNIDLQALANALNKVPAPGRSRSILRTSSFPASITLPPSQPEPTKRKRKLKKKKKPKKARLSPLEREIFEELNEELEFIEKESRRLPAVPTRGELELLFNEVKLAAETGDIKDHRDYLILRVFYATGCRRSELEGIVFADLNLAEQRIFVRDGKNNKDRYVLIDSETAKLLDDFTSQHRLDTPLFDIEEKQINRRVIHWAEKTGIAQRYEAQDRSFTSHSLRHAFATHMWENGADLYILRDLLGHRYLTTTRIYVSVGVGKMLRKYETAHPLEIGWTPPFLTKGS